MNDLLQIGDKYMFVDIGGSGLVYEVIGITEHYFPDGNNSIESKYFNPYKGCWRTLMSNGGTLQKLFDDGELILVGRTLKPNRYIMKHKIK